MIVSIVPETAEVDISTPYWKLELAQPGERTINLADYFTYPSRRERGLDIGSNLSNFTHHRE
jgi:hypothetical protein